MEAIVAFTLLSGALAFATPLVVKHSRLLAAQRDYRLALDEVSNQIERLSIVPQDELATALPQLKPSDLVTAKLPGAKLLAELNAADMGRQLTLRLSWETAFGSPTAVSLTTWLPPSAQRRAEP